MVEAASDCGCDGVKFQIWTLNELDGNPYQESLRPIEILPEDWLFLINYARSQKLDVWMECYGEESVQTLGPYVDKFKISHKNAAQAVNQQTGEKYWRLGLCHYGSGYDGVAIGEQLRPTPLKFAQIDQIDIYSKSRPVLYADHTDPDHGFDTYICAMAAAKGARIIEKHLTLDRHKQGRDWYSALDPDDFYHFCITMRALEDAL
jgi:sialic acid synthase SpsE